MYYSIIILGFVESCGTRGLSCGTGALVSLWRVGSSFLDQGSNPRPLCWKADSQTLGLRGGPYVYILCLILHAQL